MSMTGTSVSGSAGVSGSISISNVSDGATNLTTDGFEDWYAVSGAQAPAVRTKASTDIISAVSLVNGISQQSWVNHSNVAPSYSVGDCAEDPTGNSLPQSLTGYDTGGASNGKIQFTVPAGTSAHKVTVLWGSATDATTAILRATLSDSSFAEQTVSVTAGFRKSEITYNAASNSKTLTVSIECSTASYITFGYIAYDAL
jgi:hypothetical protein